MPLRHRIAVGCALTALLAPAATTPAQFRLDLGQQELGPGANPNQPRQTVYVRDSAVAGEKLALAQRMERLKEWNKAADVYQEIVEKYADRVVPASGTDASGTDAAGNATRYTSVTVEVQKRLGKWPDDGLQVYRGRYETAAATLLEQADPDDPAGLTRVLQLYFPTDAAKSAGLRLMELYIQTGEFSAAAWLGERLLEDHPGVVTDRPKVLFRTAFAEHLAGDEATARAKLDELKTKHAGATGTVRGQDVQLADELAKLMASPPPVAHGGASDSWPMFGGDASRGRVPDAAGRPGAKVAEISFPRGSQRGMTAERKAQADALEKVRRDQGLNLCIAPVLDRGELYFHDNTRVYAKSVDSGLSLPGWEITYGPESRNARFGGPGGFLGTGEAAVTLTESSVLAILGQTDNIAFNRDTGQVLRRSGDTQLVCLDRATGSRKWFASPRQLPEGQQNLRDLDFIGTPLVIGDNVYVQARGGKPMQFEDAYVLCYSLADGKLRWACYLASGNAQGDNFTGQVVASNSVSHLAYAGGRVYVVTNLGAVAAVDAYGGTIAWLSLYPKPRQFANPFIAMQMRAENGSMGSQQRKPWAHNPAIVRDGKVFALPSDAEHAIVYDAATGETIKQIATDDYDDAETLLGVVGDRLVLASLNKVYCVNWPKYDAGKGREQSLWWSSNIAGPSSGNVTPEDNRDTIRGRGFVTTDAVFVPTKWNLRRIDLSGGRVTEKYPADGSWPSGEGPGNVLVTGDQVIVAGADGIIVYSDLALARAKLDRAVEQAPADPMPRVKYAETLFAAGQIDAAVAKLDEAINLLGGIRSMRAGPERDWIFARALTFAERSADSRYGVTDPARAAGLYDRAAAAASTPAQQVAWRLSRARFSTRQQDFNAEVRFFQEILADPEFRAVSVPTDDGNGTQLAGTVAEAAINSRLRSTPAAYKPFEDAATAAMQAAKNNHDAAALLNVARTYPNARVAPAAMLAAAEAYEAAGKNRPAGQVLSQLYRKYRENGDRARILEAQARNYLRLPGCVDVAIGKLAEGAKLPGGPPQLAQALVLPDGSTIENVTFGAAAELLQKYSARIENASLPDFRIAIMQAGAKNKPFLPEDPATVLSNVDLLVLPPRELRNYARNDRVATWSADRGDSIYAVGSNTPLATHENIKQQPRGGAWVGNDLIVWTANRIALLRGDGGAGAGGWEVNVSSLPPVEMVGGEVEMAGADAGRANPVGREPPFIILNNNGVIMDQRAAFRRGRQILPNGQVVQRPAGAGAGGGGGAGGAAADAEKIEHVRPIGDRVLIATSTGRIAAFELSNGGRAWQTRLGDAPFDQVVANDDFVAVRYGDETGVQLAAMETYTGQIVFRRGFANETGQVPQNMALSPDGTLVFTLPTQLCGKDLYDPKKDLKFPTKPGSEGGSPAFAGATQPDQLVVAEGRVLAVADNGQFVRVMSIDDGEEIYSPLSTPKNSTAPQENSWNVWIRTVGPRLYIINSRTVCGYSIDRPEETWPGSTLGKPNVRNAFIGKNHIVLLDQPAAEGAEPGASAGHFRLLAFARRPRGEGKGGESGKIDQTPTVSDPAGIDQWQPVEGGFYYRSLDHKAHFLRGAAPAAGAANPGAKPTATP
jgi:outer membrane protein assembly factor BamB/tetratricopeptide (TPR) repeat protein